MLSYLLILSIIVATGYAQMNTTNGTCDTNEVYVECAQHISCQPTCRRPNGSPCPRMCGLRPCECAEGYVRNLSSQCIPQSQCEIRVARAAATCGDNEVSISCVPLQRCQPSCEKPDGTPCPRVCSPIPCVCKENYVRVSTTNSTCVPQSECSQSASGRDLKCGRNAVASNCTNPCQASCTEPNRQPCPTLTCSSGCICAPDYLRATNQASSPCVKCKN